MVFLRQYRVTTYDSAPASLRVFVSYPNKAEVELFTNFEKPSDKWYSFWIYRNYEEFIMRSGTNYTSVQVVNADRMCIILRYKSQTTKTWEVTVWNEVETITVTDLSVPRFHIARNDEMIIEVYDDINPDPLADRSLYATTPSSTILAQTDSNKFEITQNGKKYDKMKPINFYNTTSYGINLLLDGTAEVMYAGEPKTGNIQNPNFSPNPSPVLGYSFCIFNAPRHWVEVYETISDNINYGYGFNDAGAPVTQRTSLVESTVNGSLARVRNPNMQGDPSNGSQNRSYMWRLQPNYYSAVVINVYPLL